jgi:hypothetical protein
MKSLDAKRQAKSMVYYQKKKQLERVKKQAFNDALPKIGKINEQLAAMGYA